jgi:hypothetical protein
LIGLFLPFFTGSWYPGQSIFDPIIDYPIVIYTRSNRKITIASGAVSSPASLMAQANKLFFGPVKFTGIRGNGQSMAAPNSLITDVAFTYPGDANFVRGNIIRQAFTARWLMDRTATITGATNANPCVITTAANHGLLPGDQVTISGVVGTTAINGTFTVAPTGLTETAFELYQLGTTTSVAANAAYTSGGAVTRFGALPSGAISGTSNANPDVITTAADHGLLPGDTVTIAGVVGDTNVNGTFTVSPTGLTETTFELYALGTNTPIAGNAAYVSGGTFTRANVGDSGVKLQPDKTDDGGVIDMLFVEADVKVECIPVGPSVADLIAMANIQGTSIQGNSLVRGASAGANGIPLYLNGAGIYIKVPLATLVDPQNILYSPTKKRLGKVSWNSEMAFPGNVPQPLLQVSTTPIA